MEIVIIILIGLVCLVGLLLVVALFSKKEYGVVREVIINKPKSEVFEYLRLLKN